MQTAIGEAGELQLIVPLPYPTVTLGTLPDPDSIPKDAIRETSRQENQPASLTNVAPIIGGLSGVGLASVSLVSLLLPQAASERGQQAKTWIGTGLPPIPKALYEKILRWEYVDFAELCPRDPLDTAGLDPDPQRYIMLPGLEVARAKRKTIKDIYTWVSCFALYVTVLATKYPDRTPAMMAYLLTILRAQREYEDPAWRTYDESFREMAASTGLKDWSKPDESIFTRVFTGRARKVQLCNHCSLAGHTADDCPQSRKRPRESRQLLRAQGRQSNICWDYNEGRCKFTPCKYRHICDRCSGRHPRYECTAPASKRPSPKRHVNGEVPPSGRPGRQLTSRSDQQ